MELTTKIVCIGSLNVDITLFVDELCKKDEERIINEIITTPGGSAANVAAGIGQLGKNVYFFGNIGKDIYTNMLLSDFDKNYVNYSIAKHSNNPNNSCYSIVDKNSDSTLYAYNYVNFSHQDFPETFYNSSLKSIVFTSLGDEKILKDYEIIAKNAKENGTKIIFSPGNIFAKFGIEKIKKLMQLSSYLVLSETEFEIINLSTHELAEICPKILITKGKEGVELHLKDKEPLNFKAYNIQNPVDSTGAGDCFLAAFITKISENQSETKAIDFAMKAAALSVTKKGARAMPTHEEIYKFS